MDIALVKIISDLPLILSLMVIAFFLVREILRYQKSKDTINGKTSTARIEFDREVETTQRSTQKELFALFTQMMTFNRDKNESDNEYHRDSLKAQYAMIAAVEETKDSIAELGNKIILPEEHIIQSILGKLQEIQIEFVKYHEKNKQEILDQIAKINKI